jgi:DNA-directed RNA polymerase specialized sigma24 family protein
MSALDLHYFFCKICIPANPPHNRVSAVMHGGSVKAPGQFEDLELIHQSQAGDTAAFDELVTKYRTRIYTMLYGMVRNENDAWDLAQEGFLKAWRSIQKFEGRSSFYTWLHSLTVNLAIDSLRRQGRRVPAIDALRSVSTSTRLWHSFLQSIALSLF